MISNLQYSPSSAPQVPNGIYTLTGTIDFVDADGNVSALHLTTSSGANITTPVSLPGITSGTLQGNFTFSVAQVGHYTFEVWLEDLAGQTSNHLSGTFDVIPNDTANTWVQQTSGTTVSLRKVAWSGTQFVVVGDSGTILTSPDGIAWTPRTSGISSNLRGIAWSGAEFVAVGSGGTILSSPDGIVWTIEVSGVTENLRSVVWAGTQFVAVGSSSSLGSDAPILTSPDGVQWTRRTSGLSGWDLWNIAWSGTRLAIVGAAQYNPAPNDVLTSVDGITWATQQVVFPHGEQYLFDLTWSGSKFVAVGPIGYVATSPDGLTWQSQTSSSLGLQYAVGWTGRVFTSVGWDINTSLDGATWTRIAPLSGSVWGIVWGNNEYVVVGDSGVIMTSP